SCWISTISVSGSSFILRAMSGKSAASEVFNTYFTLSPYVCCSLCDAKAQTFTVKEEPNFTSMARIRSSEKVAMPHSRGGYVVTHVIFFIRLFICLHQLCVELYGAFLLLVLFFI